MGKDAEDDSAPKSAVEKPLRTEDMVNSMLRDSPLPDTERSDEKLPEDGGSDKLPKEDDGEMFPEGGDKTLSEKAPSGKLVPPCTEKVPFLCS